jgi:branched-chain amino acid transport system substrate-binding protein
MKRSVNAVAAVILAIIGVAGSVFAVEVPASAATSKSVIQIGMVADLTGAISATFGGWEQVINVWVKYTNAHGGIDGHPVQVTTIDSQSNGANALTATRQLVESDHVAAVIPAITSPAAISSYIESKKFPAVGGLGSDVTYTENQYLFAASTTGDNLSKGIILAGVKAGVKKVGVFYCSESPACSQTLPTIMTAAKDTGATYVFDAEVSGSQPSYAAPCLAAQSKGVNMAFLNVAPQGAIRVAEGCASQGYKPQYVTSSQVYIPDFLTTPALNKTLIGAANPAYVANTPGMIAYRAAIKKYDPAFMKSQYWGQTPVQAWASAQLIKAAIIASNPSPTAAVNSADVLKGLYSLRNTTLGGVTPPLTFTKGTPHSVNCSYEAQVLNGKLVVTNPAPVCPK